MRIAGTDKAPSIFTAPSLNDSYCNWSDNSSETQINAHSIVKSTIVFAITLSIILSNLMFIVTINSQFYSKITNQQFRYLLTCLAINDFAIGLLVTSCAIVPALVQCWPFGDTVCQIQASLREILPRQSVAILMCTAVDRYISVRYPKLNQKCCTNKVCMLTISLALVAFLSVFVTLVISQQGYYFNSSGLSACDIFYMRPSFRMLSACMYYFPATMLFMYCYGSIYHFSHKKYSTIKYSLQYSLHNFNLKSARSPQCHKREQEERQHRAISSKMGMISFMFIVTTTPWFINEMIVGGTGYKVSTFFDSLFTYAALSNSFWNPFLFWSLDHEFRTSFVHILFRTKDAPDDDDDDDDTWANTKSVHYCHDDINAIHVIDTKSVHCCHDDINAIHVIDTNASKQFMENNVHVDPNLYPSCPTPPPPPRVKQPRGKQTSIISY